VTGASPPPDVERTLFDVAVVGSGFGGGTMAYALSRAGLNVLLIERGGWPHRDETDWNGRAILLDGRYRGESPIEVDQRADGPPVQLLPNEAVGGNSVFFGGAALRLRATDFARWPIAYRDLERHYTAAEALLEVHGRAGEDPVEPPRSAPYPFEPPPLTAPAQRIFDAARKLGWRPFQIPVAINHAGPREPRCLNCFTCDGFPCRIGAKNDVTQTALAKADPARLAILARTVAARLLVRDGRVVAMDAIDRDGDRRFTVRARLFVLAAGALATPALMLRSGLDRLDASDSIGRYLMRHCNAMLGYLFPFRTNPRAVNHKQVCISDFYESARQSDGTALGLIQDMCMPPPDVVRALGPRGFRWAAYLGAAHIQTLLCVAEDDAQAENRVTLDAGGAADRWGATVAAVHHRYSEADLRRRDRLVALARRVLRAAGGVAGKVRLIDSFSHAVGTARFGVDPTASVLDRHCRFWSLPNLFAVDGSFMPTSGGVNPSLTITANALRVAEHVTANFAALTARMDSGA
jgi:choline dehydrogenase-like flavoprotein